MYLVKFILKTHVNGTYEYIIAEAPFTFHKTKRFIPLDRPFLISTSQNISSDHVRIHDLSTQNKDGLHFFIDECEDTLCVAAVVLVNSVNTLTLDPDFLKSIPDKCKINIPVYIISSEDGLTIIEYIKKSSSSNECKCLFPDFIEESEQHRESKLYVFHKIVIRSIEIVDQIERPFSSIVGKVDF